MTIGIILGCIIALFFALVYESPFLAVLPIAGVVYAVGAATVGAAIMANPWIAVGIVAGYITAGSLGALFLMWPAYIRKTVRRYKKSRQYQNGWKYTLPKASTNKKRIGSWVTYWPMHILVWFADDPIRALINRIIYHSRHVFTGVAVKTAKRALASEGIEDWKEEDIQL